MYYVYPAGRPGEWDKGEGGVHHVASAIGGWEQVRHVVARINQSFIFVILLSNIFRTLKYIITCWIDVTVVLQTGTLTKSSLEDFDRNISLRAKTHFILAKYLLPELAKTDGEIKKLEQAMWLLMSHNLCTIWYKVCFWFYWGMHYFWHNILAHLNKYKGTFHVQKTLI